ncbi:alpha/beta hydrolase family protein [Streptomyces sp. OR43]|uniref:alpha/beta hydrolase family protein n=1 Tax=Streptomyces sp. or43 TaxID=2478957 RepID=UPI0011CD8A55|nr:alpha/beta fold hydrolase [Streptomyces sp. or43]TXS42972.1 S9 family peptidase [Streptomyces sp. or43]
MPRTAAIVVRRVREAMLRLVHPVEARISPDGRAVAVAAAGPERAELVLAPVPAALTGRAADVPGDVPRAPSGPAASTDRHSPRWLPDSRTLLHIAESDGPTGAEVRLDALDTQTGAVRTVVRAPGAVEELLVSDDGRQALLLCAADGAERDGMHLGLPVRLGAVPAPERFAPGTGRRSLHLVGLADGSLREAGPAGLTVWNIAWRGGSTAVATVCEDTLPAGYYDARFAALDLDARTSRTVYTPQGQLGAPALAADGRSAAVCEGISIVAGRPVVADLATGNTTVAAGVEDATWLRFDDTSPGALWFAGWDGTGSRVGHTAHPGVVRWSGPVTLGGAGYQPGLSLSRDGLLAATVLDAPGRPPEAVVTRTEGPAAWNWTPVTTLNAQADPELAGLRTEQIHWSAPDGRTVQGLVLSDGDSTGPRPLAVLVHGGPAWLWSAGYAPGDVLGLAPALAAAGYLVLLPNPRGSSGRGLEHARAVVGDVGGADLEDVLSGVRHLTGAGLADPDRTAVLGHSYGGFLAAQAAARTDVFRAAVVVSAPTDWLSFTHTSNIGGGYDRTYAIGGPDAPQELIRRSPVFARGGSGTPTLIVHGSADRVTPVGQAQELYRSLLRTGRAPVELYVYPDEGHEFTDGGHLLDAAARVEQWLATHLAPRPAAAHPTAVPGDASPEPIPGTAFPAGPEDVTLLTPSGPAIPRPASAGPAGAER